MFPLGRLAWALLSYALAARVRRALRLDQVTDEVIDDVLEAFRQYGEELISRPEEDSA